MLYLINYLGTFFLWTFIIFQVTTCVAVFLVISPILSQDKMSLFQRIISSVCFAMMAYHYTSVLYFITMTVEKAHEDLKMLSTSLKQVLLIENDVMKKESLKILIKEVDFLSLNHAAWSNLFSIACITNSFIDQFIVKKFSAVATIFLRLKRFTVLYL